ncbi:hypothetical protein ACIREE_18905 [Streptomyces sp. NPDC102467]|uniref:hypothetical protein n=1 Tax=Streptomyces sp. NPDC102467 TaxID=3366179 RepID=UPI00380B5277
MTSTTDTAEHPEVTEISDLAEGLLPPSRTSDIRRHLDSCVLCADVYASIEEIRGTLGALPDPPRMPEDIAGRIDAALAAEALLYTLAPAPADAEEDAQETTDPVSRETSGVDAPEPPPRSMDRPAGHPRAAAGPGRKPRSVRRRTSAALGAALTAAALGVGVLLLQNGDGTPTARESGAADTLAEGSLNAKVSELLGTGGEASPSPSLSEPSFGTQESGPKTPQSLRPMPKLATTVPACVQLGTHRNEDPLAAEKGTYEGKSVYLVVLPHKTDPAHRVTAFIVDSACVKQATSAGKLLYTHDYDRG